MMLSYQHADFTNNLGVVVIVPICASSHTSAQYVIDLDMVPWRVRSAREQQEQSPPILKKEVDHPIHGLDERGQGQMDRTNADSIIVYITNL